MIGSRSPLNGQQNQRFASTESCKLCTLSWTIDIRLLCSKSFKKHGTQCLLNIETTWSVYYTCKVDTLIHIDPSSVYHSLQYHCLSLDPTILSTQASNFMCCWLCTIACSQKHARKVCIFRSCNDFPCRNSHHIVMCCMLKHAFLTFYFCSLLSLLPTHWDVVLF